MGRTRLDREVWRARGAYLAAVRRVAAAMTRFHDLDVPLEPHGGHLPPWTPEQIRAVIEVQKAWTELVSTRRMHDRMAARLR